MEARPTRRVSHPILHLEVVERDATRTAGEPRVFCRLRRESIDVDYCRQCSHCDAIHSEPAPAVNCTFIPRIDALDPDPRGERTEVGTLLKIGSVVVASSASLTDALAVLRAQDLRSVAVVGGHHILVGILHDRALSQRCATPGHTNDPATSVMSSAIAIHEATPVRTALRFLASAHLREAAVVTAAGIPLGLFKDVDGLRWIAHAQRGAGHSVGIAGT